MKRFLPTFIIIILVLALYPFIGSDMKPATGLPWQIDVGMDGSTTVFGITLAKSTFADAVDRIGEDMELAVIAHKDETGSLEMYFGRYQAGLLNGKMIVTGDVDEITINGFRNRAVIVKVLESGARKYLLDDADREQAMKTVISNIAFIPAINLDHEVIISRFGNPEAIVHSDEQMHYLYPEKGLDVILSETGKEVLQYVSPDVFKRLSEPLLEQPPS